MVPSKLNCLLAEVYLLTVLFVYLFSRSCLLRSLGFTEKIRKLVKRLLIIPCKFTPLSAFHIWWHICIFTFATINRPVLIHLPKLTKQSTFGKFVLYSDFMGFFLMSFFWTFYPYFIALSHLVIMSPQAPS